MSNILFAACYFIVALVFCIGLTWIIGIGLAWIIALIITGIIKYFGINLEARHREKQRLKLEKKKTKQQLLPSKENDFVEFIELVHITIRIKK